MAKKDKSILQKDKDGNIILKEPLMKKYAAILLLVFSGILLLGSLYLLIKGVFTPVNIIRITGSALVLAYAIWMLGKREVFIITPEKVVAYNSWEVLLKDIDTVTLHKFLFVKMLIITSGNSEYTIEQTSVTVPLEAVAEYLTKKLKKK